MNVRAARCATSSGTSATLKTRRDPRSALNLQRALRPWCIGAGCRPVLPTARRHTCGPATTRSPTTYAPFTQPIHAILEAHTWHICTDGRRANTHQPVSPRLGACGASRTAKSLQYSSLTSHTPRLPPPIKLMLRSGKVDSLADSCRMPTARVVERRHGENGENGRGGQRGLRGHG